MKPIRCVERDVSINHTFYQHKTDAALTRFATYKQILDGPDTKQSRNLHSVKSGAEVAKEFEFRTISQSLSSLPSEKISKKRVFF